MLLFSHLETFTMCFFIKKGQNFSYSQCRSKSNNARCCFGGRGGGCRQNLKLKNNKKNYSKM